MNWTFHWKLIICYANILLDSLLIEKLLIGIIITVLLTGQSVIGYPTLGILLTEYTFLDILEKLPSFI